jgi:HSP20 family protein
MANINRWSPFDEVLSLRDAMQRLFEDSVVAPSMTPGRGASIPNIELNVHERAEAFVVEACVPGLKPEDLDLTIQDNVLTITGEIRAVEQPEGTTTHRTERRYGRFTRSISLPTQVKGDAVSAVLEHGVLRLEIPKAEAVKPRKINVQVAQNEGRSLEAGKGK